jgi:hypothetical protein
VIEFGLIEGVKSNRSLSVGDVDGGLCVPKTSARCGGGRIA